MEINNAITGCTGLGSLESKADALVWAISFTSSWTPSSGNVINYEKAKELFNFICLNVNLPDTKGKNMDEFFAAAKDSLSAVMESVAKQNADTPAKDVNEHTPSSYETRGKI